jgi:holo-[acyl-carrier protein] synthase
MILIGHGVDIVEIEDVRRLLEEPGQQFFLKSFTARETRDAGDGPNRAARLAGRFAAKEAVVKALNTGWGDGIAWTDVEIGILESGAPTVTLRGAVAAVAKERGVSAWIVSTSHTDSVAMASALALGDCS